MFVDLIRCRPVVLERVPPAAPMTRGRFISLSYATNRPLFPDEWKSTQVPQCKRTA
jgi:hypothetical protein